MATEKAAMEKVREELICAICLDFLREPKVLLCAHSFCLECLRRIVSTQKSYRFTGETGTEDLECPSCRHVSQLPGGKVESLKTNYNLKRLVDIVSEENKRLARASIKKWRAQKPTIDRSRQPLCKTHQKPQEYFCSDCSELLCRKCMIASHKDHNYQDVEEILPAEISALRNLIQPACEVASRAEATMKQLYHERDIVSTNGTATSETIRLLFHKMREALDARENALLTTVQKYTDMKLTQLDFHHHRLDEDRKAILRIVDTIEKMVQHSQNAAVLSERQAISEELDLHQQSVLSVSDSPKDYTESTRFLAFKEDHSLLRTIDELGTLNECRREPNSVFLSVRRVVVSEDEDPYLDVPLRFEDNDSTPAQESVRVDETLYELQLSSTNGLTEEGCYDYPRPLLPQPEIELRRQPATKPKTKEIPTSGVSKPPLLSPKPALKLQQVPTPPPHRAKLPPHRAKPPPHAPVPAPRTQPPCSPKSDQPPIIPPHEPLQSSNRHLESCDTDLYDIPRSLSEMAGGTYDTPRHAMNSTYDSPRPKPPPRSHRSPSGSQYLPSDSSDEDSYEPVSDFVPIPKPRKRPPPLPPNHPSQQEKPIPRPRRAVSFAKALSVNVTNERKKRSSTLPQGFSPCFPEDDDVLIPVMVLGKEELSLPFSHETVFPCGVYCRGTDDCLVVTDVFNHCLRLVDSNGKFLEKIGREGRGGGQFKEPSAVVVTPNNQILVAERDNPRVQKFNPSGKYLLKFGQKVLWGSQLSDPVGLAVNLNGNIYVSDWDKSAIFVFSNTGKLLFVIKKDELRFPAGITFDKRGRLLVVDRKSHCVHILTPEGDYVGQIGSEGTKPGQLYFPYGIAVTPKKGNVIVTESGNDRVSVFSASGTFLECFGRHGSEAGMFNHPRHVCVNSKEQVIIADEMNQRLQVFELDL